LHASNKEVIAALAAWGIGVNEERVRLVKVDMLKEMARAKRHKARVPDCGKVRQLRLPPKIPPSR